MDFDETSVSSHKSDGTPQMVGGGDIEDLFFLNQNLSSQKVSLTKECVIECSASIHALFEEEKQLH